MALTGGLMTGDNAAQQGLGWAANTMQNAQQYNYPSYVSSANQSPTQMAYADYSANAPMAQVTAPDYSLTANKSGWQSWNPQQANTYAKADPNSQAAGYNWQDTALNSGQNVNSQNAQTAGYGFNNYGVAAPQYQGLMGGDYNALQTALTTPGQIAAQNAYNTGSANLNNTMSGRGLYGSSIMANSANEGINREYMNAQATNAANAAAQRYGLQQTDLQNASAQEMAGWQSGMNQSLAGNSANLDYAKLQTGVNQQNTANNLAAQQTNQSNNMQYQQLLSQQGLAKNAAGLSQAQLQTGVNQQNTANALNQAQSLNALQSGDTQALNSLTASQNTAQNAYGKDMYGLDISREQDQNAAARASAQMMATQNANTYAAGSADATRQTTYNQNAQQYALQQAEQQRQWQNQYGSVNGGNSYDQNQYQMASNLYGNQQTEAQINQALALANQGAPLSTAASNYQLQQQNMAQQKAAADQAINAQNTSGLLGAAGTAIGGGLLAYNMLK